MRELLSRTQDSILQRTTGTQTFVALRPSECEELSRKSSKEYFVEPEPAGAAHSRGGALSSACWRDGQRSPSFGTSVQSRRALAARRRLVASDALGAAPTQRAALDISRRRDAGGEGATRRDAGQALPPGGRDQQPGPSQSGSWATRPEARNGYVRREQGAERERSWDGKRDKEKDQKKGDGKRRGRKSMGTLDELSWAQIFRGGVRSKETRILNLESAFGAAMRACRSAVCLDQWRDGLGRGSESLGMAHIIETSSVAWDAPCSPFRRFESELSKTALTGYAERDLQSLSLESARYRLGHFLTLWVSGSKRRTCALWVLLIVKAVNWLSCAGSMDGCSVQLFGSRRWRRAVVVGYGGALGRHALGFRSGIGHSSVA